MKNSGKAEYIRGLMDGLQLDPEKKETKVLNAVVDLLEEICSMQEGLSDAVGDLVEQVNDIDEDLGELEVDFYGDEEDGCDCENCRHNHGGDEEFQVTCPSCGKDFKLTDEMLDDTKITCPNCGETLELDYDDEDDDDAPEDGGED